MLSEDQINSLLLDKDLSDIVEQVLGTPITEVCPQPMAVVTTTLVTTSTTAPSASSSSSSSQPTK